MRNRIILLVVIAALLATVVVAATLTVTVPTGSATTNALAQCERLRTQNRVIAANWNNDICASVMTREGVLLSTFEDAQDTRNATVSACTSAANNTFQQALNDFDTDWPFPATVSTCGDSVADIEFGEDCDDGGESEACNTDCTTSVCGDGFLNVTDHEQCDDGNVIPGDGCDAICHDE